LAGPSGLGVAGAEPDDDLERSLEAVRGDPGVRAALAELFSRNRRDAAGNVTVDGPTAAQALAAEALHRLLEPGSAGVADVGGLRLHVTLPSDLHPGAGRISASAWDDDAEVWREVGEVDLPAGP